ncbi:hypothetical protein GCM10009748_18050 [Agromyces lapidis]
MRRRMRRAPATVGAVSPVAAGVPRDQGRVLSVTRVEAWHPGKREVLMREAEAFRVVVGVDGSRPSIHALAWAVREARLRRGTLRVLTAWDYPAVIAGMDGVLDVSHIEDATRRTQSVALSKVAHDDVPVSAEVLRGSPGSVLVEASVHADLIVIGSRGLGGFGGLLLGSVSAQVARHAACSVLVVRPGEDLPDR